MSVGESCQQWTEGPVPGCHRSTFTADDLSFKPADRTRENTRHILFGYSVPSNEVVNNWKRIALPDPERGCLCGRFRENGFELPDELCTLRRLQLVEVLLLPSDRWQITCVWHAQELPVRLAALE